jgi:glycosyltransferase involved in cell wall biosynthesis
MLKKNMSKFVYIPNGVKLPEILESQEIGKLWNLKKDSYILAASRLVRHKGIHHLIRAYLDIETDKKLVIAGESSFTDDYAAEIKELAAGNKNIIFTGNQTGRALAELFSNAYLFVQPSEYEGLSIALLEAMSYSLPVLVSDIPENLEAVRENGLKFKNKDWQDLKKQLQYALENGGEIKKLGKNARQRVAEEYDTDKAALATIDLYQSLKGLK